MKRIIPFLLIPFILACYVGSQPSPIVTNIPVPTLVPPTPTPTVIPTFAPVLEYITTTDLEKRACPSVACANVGYFLEGETVYVDGWHYDANLDECQRWAHVSQETYWVCADYLIENPFTPDEVYNPLDYAPNIYVICGIEAVPVYGNPGGTDIMYYLPIGTEVKIREMSKVVQGWAMIKDSRWVWHEYLCEK